MQPKKSTRNEDKDANKNEIPKKRDPFKKVLESVFAFKIYLISYRPMPQMSRDYFRLCEIRSF